MHVSLMLALQAKPYSHRAVEYLAESIGLPINYLSGARAGLIDDPLVHLVPSHLLGVEFIAGYAIARFIRRAAMTPHVSTSVVKAKRAAQASVESKAKRAGHQNAATSQKDYTGAELEFMDACEKYKAKHNIRFLTKTDYFAVLMELGYSKIGLFA